MAGTLCSSSAQRRQYDALTGVAPWKATLANCSIRAELDLSALFARRHSIGPWAMGYHLVHILEADPVVQMAPLRLFFAIASRPNSWFYTPT